ncbi:MAG: hypothetical protein OEM29_05030 [Thermoplasmata archaeon]|nr:hypothetical protein [Thermoplasmata archaeon]
MKCPDCGGAVEFRRSDITCTQCDWRPSPTVLKMWQLAPLTNRRILFGTLLTLASAGAYTVFHSIFWPALVLFICGLALLPVHLAVRSYAVKRMIAEIDGI